MIEDLTDDEKLAITADAQRYPDSILEGQAHDGGNQVKALEALVYWVHELSLCAKEAAEHLGKAY